jgi:hypothetical protein
VSKKLIGEYSIEKRISRINVELKLEESVFSKYSSVHLKLEGSIKEVSSEVRESFIESISWSKLISQSVDQLDLIKWSWIRCDKTSKLGVYSWAVKVIQWDSYESG